MEPFGISWREGRLHIEGVPDAIKLVEIRGKKAKRLAHLALHRSDLDFAASCLEAINASDNEVIRASLWRSAVIFYIKCFVGGSQRSQIHASEIYKGDKSGQEIFQQFKHLRDKHFIHDENAFSQVTPSAAINSGSKLYKIEKIITLAHHVGTLDQANYNNLILLVKKALEWVISNFELLCNSITLDLEAESYEKLIGLPQVVYTVPQLDDIGKKRQDL